MTGAPEFVLDGSIALAWFFVDERDDYADAVALALPQIEAVVPALWHLEVANTLVCAERRKRSTAAQAATFLGHLAALPITVDPQTHLRAWTETVALARLHGLSAYDGAYLELALRTGLPLATLDGRLEGAAKAAGVPRFAPPPPPS